MQALIPPKNSPSPGSSPSRGWVLVWNGIGCQFRVHPILVPEVPNVPLPLASGVPWWGSVFLALILHPLINPGMEPGPCHFSLGGLGQVTSHLRAPVCPVTWGDLMLFPGGLQGARRGVHFLGPHVMVKHTGAGLLGRQEQA